MSGRLFFPMTSKILLDKPINLHAHTGFWATKEEWLDCYGNSDYQWFRLNKTEWLSPLVTFSQQEKLRELNFDEGVYPVAVAAINGNQEVARGFIVPDNWPSQAKSFMSD